MRILHTVEFYDPSVGGSQEVVKRLSEALVERGHEVTVATTKLKNRVSKAINGVMIEEFAVSGNPADDFTGEVERYQDFLLNANFDIMMNYAAQQWATDLVFPVIEKLAYPKALAPCGYSALHLKAYQNYFRKLPEYLRHYEHIIYHSASYQDKLFGDRHNIGNFSIIPNGAAAEEFDAAPGIDFRKYYSIPGGKMILSVANHYWSKGHGLVIDAFRRSKAPDASLVIIGNPVGGGCFHSCRKYANQATKAGKPVILLQDIPRKHVVAAFKQADLFLFGSEIECFPLVLIEAMASGTPFITTDCGAAGELAGGIIVGDSRRSFLSRIPGIQTYCADPTVIADRVDGLLGDKAASMRLSKEGRGAWQSMYTWKQVVNKYEEIYVELLGAQTALKPGV